MRNSIFTAASIIVMVLIFRSAYEPKKRAPSAEKAPVAESDHNSSSTVTPPKTKTSASNPTPSNGRLWPENLKNFTSRSTQAWNMEREPLSQNLKTLNRGKLPLIGPNNQERAQKFFKEYSKDLFGVAPENLVFFKAEKSSIEGVERLRFYQTLGDKRVYGAHVTLYFEKNYLVKLDSALAPEMTSFNPPKEALTWESASSSFCMNEKNQHGPKYLCFPNVEEKMPEMVFVPEEGKFTPAYFLHMNEGATDETAQVSELLLNAHSGGLVRRVPASTKN